MPHPRPALFGAGASHPRGCCAGPAASAPGRLWNLGISIGTRRALESVMHVNEVMSAPVFTCAVTDTLNKPAALMWEHDCGCVPVVDHHGKVIAMITDRDICIAA